MTFEADAAAQTTGDILGVLSKWVERIRAQSARVAELEAQLQAATDDLNQLTLVQVPDALQEAGLTEITLEDGAKLTVKEDLKVNIPVANRAAAYAWLHANGHDMAVKQVLEVDLRPLQPAERENLLHVLDNKYHAEPTISESIHNATLKSIIAEALERGATISPAISVFQFRRAQVKEKKA
jgi:hypothetical protein